MPFSSRYSNGGVNAEYSASYGGEGGGGAGLNGQFQGLFSGEFPDPSAWINPLRQDARNLLAYRIEEQKAMRERNRQDAMRAANSGQGGWSGGGPQGPRQAAQPAPDAHQPMRQFMETKNQLDRMNETNPAFAHGQGLLGTNKEFFNVPAAGALTGVNFEPLVKQAMSLHENAAQIPSQGGQGGLQQPAEDPYMMALRMYRPDEYANLVSQMARKG
jgi:hypothetical protein